MIMAFAPAVQRFAPTESRLRTGYVWCRLSFEGIHTRIVAGVHPAVRLAADASAESSPVAADVGRYGTIVAAGLPVTLQFQTSSFRHRQVQRNTGKLTGPK